MEWSICRQHYRAPWQRTLVFWDMCWWTDRERGIAKTMGRGTAMNLVATVRHTVCTRLNTCPATGVPPSSPSVVDCGPLSDPTNGIVLVSVNTTLGTTASYECIAGYEVVGLMGEFRFCTETGMWSERDPTCERTLYTILVIGTQSTLSPQVWIVALCLLQ